MELELLEVYNAERARDRIFQELENRGFTSENRDAALGLGDCIVDIILQECCPSKFPKSSPVKKEECKAETPDELDQIFEDFLDFHNDQREIT